MGSASSSSGHSGNVPAPHAPIVPVTPPPAVLPRQRADREWTRLDDDMLILDNMFLCLWEIRERKRKNEAKPPRRRPKTDPLTGVKGIVKGRGLWNMKANRAQHMRIFNRSESAIKNRLLELTHTQFVKDFIATYPSP